MFSKFAQTKWRWGVLGLALVLAAVFGVMALTRGGDGAQAQVKDHTTGLAITKTCPASGSLGDTVTCVITVENQDPDHGVRDLVVTDTVPFPGGPTNRVAGCASILTANDGVQGSGGDFTSCSVRHTLSAACDALLTDKAEANGADNDPIPLPDGFGGLPISGSATGVTRVLCPDLRIVKTPDGAVINAGDPATFTTVVTNNGPGTALNVTLTDTLPDSGLSWSESPDNPKCTISAGPPQVLSCNFGNLAAGASASVTVTTPTDSADCKKLDNLATADADNDDPVRDPGDITVVCPPDLRVKKTPDGGVINAGDPASFTIEVSNAGPGTAFNVTLTDTLPDSGLSWSESPDNPKCTISAGPPQVLTCSFGNLAAGASVSVTVTTPTDEADCKRLDNLATADADNDDPVSDRGDITVECPAGEGCTPGYWKQPQHFDSWTAPYRPGDRFSAYFDNAFPGMTLLQVLWQGGGGLNALGRHTVAALLNAASPGVSYAFSPAQVISMFNAVFPGGDYEALKNKLAGENERGCPLN